MLLCNRISGFDAIVDFNVGFLLCIFCDSSLFWSYCGMVKQQLILFKKKKWNVEVIAYVRHQLCLWINSISC